jgi:uncharacterized membrane protein
MTKYTAGRGLGILLLIAGSAHFLAPAGFDAIIPPILPFEPRLWTYLSGAAELTIGASMFAPMSKKLFGKPIRQIGVYLYWFTPQTFIWQLIMPIARLWTEWFPSLDYRCSLVCSTGAGH